jgi:hypothetical protein
MHAKKGNEIIVDVDGIGTFQFAQRTVRSQLLIRGEYNRLTSGNYNDEGQPNDLAGWAAATISVLMVEGPEGFELEKLDVYDNWDDKVISILTALSAKEASFRKKPEKPNPGGGQATIDKPAV